MPYGFTCKEISRALNVGVGRTSDAIRPAMLKMAKLFFYDPEKAMKGIVQAMGEVRAEAERSQRETDEHEIEIRTRMNEGRLDRRVLHPDGR